LRRAWVPACALALLPLAADDLAFIRQTIGPLDPARLAGLAREGSQAWLANQFVTHSVFPINPTNAGQFQAIGATLYWGRQDLGGALERLDAQIGESWVSVMPESALFLACGLVLGFMREPVVAEAARAVLAFVPHGYPGLLVMLVGVPLVTTLGIHPMALFAVLAPVLTPSTLGMSEPAVFQAWIAAAGLSMIVSPASILTVTTVLSFGVPADQLCLRGNGLYAAGLAAIATCCFLMLS